MTTTTITMNKKSGSSSNSGVPFGIAFMAFLYCFINGYLQSKYLTKFYDTSKYNSSKSSSSSSSSNISEYSYNFEVGIVLIIIGFWIVVTSDRILLNLKKQNQLIVKKRMVTTTTSPITSSTSSNNNNNKSRYSIPYGGSFYWVSSPHYFGELLEWIGFCIASNYSLCSLSFVLWTAANLIPRSIHTHNWYKKTFQDNNNHHDSNDNDDVDDDDDDDEEDWVVVDVNYSDLNRKAIIPFIL